VFKHMFSIFKQHYTLLFLVHLFQVEKLVLIDASVYAEGTGNLATLPRIAAYAGVSLSINLLAQTTNNFKLFLLSKFI